MLAVELNAINVTWKKATGIKQVSAALEGPTLSDTHSTGTSALGLPWPKSAKHIPDLPRKRFVVRYA